MDRAGTRKSIDQVGNSRPRLIRDSPYHRDDPYRYRHEGHGRRPPSPRRPVRARSAARGRQRHRGDGCRRRHHRRRLPAHERHRRRRVLDRPRSRDRPYRDRCMRARPRRERRPSGIGRRDSTPSRPMVPSRPIPSQAQYRDGRQRLGSATAGAARSRSIGCWPTPSTTPSTACRLPQASTPIPATSAPSSKRCRGSRSSSCPPV